MDGGAWWAAIYGVAQSWTRLSDLAEAAALNLCKALGFKPITNINSFDFHINIMREIIIL